MSMSKVQIIGNVGRDPEQRYTQTGTMSVSFSVAVNNRRRGQDGQFQDETEWYRVNTVGRLAEVCQQYVAKGNQIYVDGRLSVDRWTGQDGQPRFGLTIFANDVQFIGSRVRTEEVDQYGQGSAPATGPASRGGSQPAAPSEPGDLEDLPF